MRRAIGLCCVVGLSGCTVTDRAPVTASPPSSSRPPLSASVSLVPELGLPSGRYWFQWTGYLAGHEDDVLYPELQFQLAWADVGEAVSQGDPESFSGLSLMTDQGPLEAHVIDVAASPSGPAHKIVTLVIGLARPDAGTYRFRQIQYTSDADDSRRLATVGTWTIEVLEGDSPDDLEEGRRLGGSTVFAGASTELENTSNDDVSIEQLVFDLGPGTTGYLVETESLSEDPTDLPLPTPSPPVVVRPGQIAYLELRYVSPLQNADASFVQVQPLIEYSSRGETRRMALGRQTFATTFQGDAHLGAYLRSLPTEAYEVGR